MASVPNEETTQVLISAPSGGQATQVVLLTSVGEGNPLTGEESLVIPEEESASILTADTATVEADDYNEEAYDAVKQDGSEHMTLIDMNQFMDVVYTYKCKFCHFSASSSEEMSNHAINVHIDSCNEVPSVVSTETLTEGDVSQDSQETEISIGDHIYNATVDEVDLGAEVADQQNQTTTEVQVSPESTGMAIDETLVLRETQDIAEGDPDQIDECQEIFVCGQCNLSFSSMQLCKEHMVQDHTINIPGIELKKEPESISAMSKTDSDKVSIGTQAMTYRKPGRKRKEPMPDTREELLPLKEEKADPESDTNDDIPGDMAVFSEEFLSVRERQGKRKIKTPKILLDDYYFTKSKEYKKRPVAPKQKCNFKCDIANCKAKFETENSLGHHKSCHKVSEDGSLQKGYFCPSCAFTTIQWAPMRLHLWTKHSLDLDLLKCDQCEYHTDASHKIEVHKQIHDEEKRFTCEACDKTFKQLSQLLHHNAIHNKNKEPEMPTSRVRWYHNRVCPICKRVLSNSRSLKKHIQFVHEKVKEYACEFCGHTAARKHMLLVHMRTHTGERPYKCDLCTFTTSDHNTLRRHRLRHTGLKPYKCQYCPYACIQAISLKIHMKNKHQNSEGLYYCQQCHYHTVNAQYWAWHQEDHKNGLIEEQDNRRYLPDNEQSGKKSKGVASIKEVLQDLKIPTEVATEGDEVNQESMTVIQEVGGGDAIEIAEIVQTGDDFLDQGGSGIQFVYAGEGGTEVSLPQTLLLEDSSADPSSKPRIQTFQIPDSNGTITFTIQQEVDGGSQIVTAQPMESLLQQSKIDVVQQEVDGTTLQATKTLETPDTETITFQPVEINVV